MSTNPLTLSRRHVLGDLYSQCVPVATIPVYWHDALGSPLGFVDESAGEYSDAFVFHIAEEFCRKLAAGQILCRFNYEYADENEDRAPRKKRSLRLTSFILTLPEAHAQPAKT